MLCGDLNETEIQKRGDLCIHVVDSLCRTVETTTTLQSNYTPIKIRINLKTATCGVISKSHQQRVLRVHFVWHWQLFFCQPDTNHAQALRAPKYCFHHAGWRHHYIRARLISAKWLELS